MSTPSTYLNMSTPLPCLTTGEFAAQSLIQKKNSGNDQQRAINREDNSSGEVCHLPQPTPAPTTTSMISQLSATKPPTARLQAQSFEELAKQNQSNKDYSHLVKSRKSGDVYTWRCYATRGLTGNLRSSYRCEHPGCPAIKSVERSSDGKITEHIHKAHNHPASQAVSTSSISAFSKRIWASNHLTIKIPDHSFVTYEGGEIDTEAASVVCDQRSVVKNPKKRTRGSRRACTTVLTADPTNFKAMVQECTGIPAQPFGGLQSHVSSDRQRLRSYSKWKDRVGLKDGNDQDHLKPLDGKYDNDHHNSQKPQGDLLGPPIRFSP